MQPEMKKTLAKTNELWRSPMSEHVMGYITCGDKKEAETVAQALLDRSLIACANIFNPITSIYKWQGKVEKDEETLLIVKSHIKHREAIIKAVKETHSYDVPCVVFYSVNSASQDYLKWLDEQI